MIVCLCAVARAVELDFTEAVRLALSEGAQVRIVSAEADAARADSRAYGAYGANPEASLEVRPDETSILFSVPIDVGVAARGSAARAVRSAADIREEAARAAVAGAAGAAYLDAVRAREIAAIAADAGALAERLRRAGNARYDAGELPADQHVLLLADAARALDKALSFRRDADAAARVLGVLAGIAPAVPPTVDGWPELAVPQDIDPSQVPAVLAADLEARAALKRRHAADLSLIPTLSLSGGWLIEGPTGPVYGASLSLPLFAPGASRVQAARAASEVQDAAAALAHLDAAQTLADALAELDIATQVAAAWKIEGLERSLDTATRRYEAGESSLVVFVNERDLALGALEAAVTSRWRLQRARLALWELAGELPMESPP